MFHTTFFQFILAIIRKFRTLTVSESEHNVTQMYSIFKVCMKCGKVVPNSVVDKTVVGNGFQYASEDEAN